MLLNTAPQSPSSSAPPILVRDVLHGDARLFGTITAAIGVGEVITRIPLAQLQIRRLGIAICAFAVVVGLALIGIGLVADVPTILVLAAAFGVQFVGVGSSGRPRCRSTCPASSSGG